MPKVLVLFHSRTGNTAAIADAIAEGAETVKFTEVDVRRVEDPGAQGAMDADERGASAHAALAKKYRALESAESLAHYDAIVIGDGDSDGGTNAAFAAMFDAAGPLRQRGALVDKVGAVFGAAGAAEGSGATPNIAMLNTLMQLGMIIVPPASITTASSDAGGQSAVSSAGSGAPTPDDLAAARRHGARVAKVAEWVRHAKSHEHQAR